MARTGVFYAFPSKPESGAETIQNAINQLKGSAEIKNATVRFRPWPDLSVTGKRLLAQITQAIDQAELFACDVTELNFNVAFELGYAISRFKRLWLSIDDTIDGSTQRFKRYYTGMMGIGYAKYENHNDLVKAFITDHPWRDLNSTVLPQDYRRPTPRPEYPTVLYIKPPFETEAVVRASEVLQSSIFATTVILDDPNESSPSLDWYAEKIAIADAVVIHVLSDQHRDNLIHNTRASFVAGMAHGFSKPVIMLGHVPFTCPTDYQILYVAHKTAQECESTLRTWIDGLNLPTRRPRRSDERARRTTNVLELRNISLGEPVAENEQLYLDDYFLETAPFFEALEAQTSILVGRRGTGKTATLIALESAFGQDKRNHVCVIKPVGYEVDGLVSLLEDPWQSAERGYLIESLWKFLIYSELAASVYKELQSRPAHQAKSQAETDFIDYLEANEAVLLAPFSQRLNRAVLALRGAGLLKETEEQRVRISEALHSSHLGVLRRSLGAVLHDKAKVAILIDNLDEPWHPGGNTRVLAELLLGLLRVSQTISEDLRHEDFRQKGVNVFLTTFLRSDIFAFLRPLAVEQDKWPLRRISWNDKETLLRVIDLRLSHAVPSSFSTKDIWETLFVDDVVGLPVKDFILSNTMARPRDVIFLVKEAIRFAVTRGHARVAENDFLDARQAYSRYVFSSILAEDDPDKGQLEAVLYEFAGAPKTMSNVEVLLRIGKGAVRVADVSFYLDLLCDVNFLGIQTSTGFRFANDENDREMLRKVAKNLAIEKGWGQESYQINPAFHQALQID